MAGMPLPYFPFYPRDFRESETVQVMTLEERGAYIMLLCHQWENGSIPSSPARIERILGLGNGWVPGRDPVDPELLTRVIDSLMPMIYEAFTPDPNDRDRLMNPRLEVERAIAQKRSDRGKKAADARHAQQPQCERNAQAVQTHCHTDTDTDTEKKKKACPEPLRVAGPSSENPKNWQDDLAVQLQDAVFIQILTNKKGQTFSVNESRIQEWEELFPAVDIKQELRNLTAWSQANPTQRKTFGGMESFIVRWLKKEQNRGGPGPRGPDRPIEPGPRPTFKNPGELKIFEADFEARRQETQKMIQQIRDKYQAERSAGP